MRTKVSCLLVAVLFINISFAQIDNSCKNINCPTGYRCDNGICLRQQQSAKKKICALNFNLVAVKCTDRNIRCNNAKSLPSCGFSVEGVKKDFRNDCLPCLDNSISFYYRTACSQAPKICSQSQECLNGNCVKMFTQQTYKDNQTCNSPKQCTRPGYTCAAGKCVKLTDLITQLTKLSSQIKLN